MIKACRVKGRNAGILRMRGKGERYKGNAVVDERKAGSVKGRKARLLWMTGKLVV